MTTGHASRAIGDAAAAEEALARRRPRAAALHWREFVLLIFASDAVLVLLTLIVVERLWEGVWTVFDPRVFDGWLFAAWLVWLFALKAGGAYDLLSGQNATHPVGAVLRSLSIVVLLTLGIYFFTPFAFPRSIGIASPLSVVAVLIVWRSIVSRRLVKWAPLQRRVLLLGLDDTTRRLAALLANPNRSVPYEVVGILTDDATAPESLFGVPVRQGTGALWDHVRRTDAHEIAVARWERMSRDEQTNLVECFYQGIAATDAAALYEELAGRVLIAHVRADWYSELPTLPRRPYFAVKRALDAAGALVALVVLSPLLLLVSLLVLVDDGPPVLFRQVRLGRRGEAFTVHKFRTMRRDAEREGPQYATARDPRSTRAGSFLRPSGLDELPQLFDILRGKMSLIGPRPERPEFVEQLSQLLPLYRSRLLVRPGIVGWSEVHVVHATSLQDHLVRLEYDLYYIKRASLVLDLNIALRTLGLLVSGRRWRSGRLEDADDYEGARV